LLSWRSTPEERLTSPFIPTILLAVVDEPRMKAPDSSSSFDMVLMLYSWEEEISVY